MSYNSEDLGRTVREVWIEWAKTQPNPKPSWLIPWEELDAAQREVDTKIGERLWHMGANAVTHSHARRLYM